ncbi:type ISP restriction/modification enzyme [Microbacterium amylolyticum]|uniref:Helicase n=1 Tax=Microbacterium amylolyticum TaxID=936337 RepID=A0ABS4ZJG8_9MICO|nr:type ISP restriction/modification enzyme [Microbacterium amylolyticum]MBP2436621.1 putative helicase [Microbacterium amylolyticum]
MQETNQAPPRTSKLGPTFAPTVPDGHTPFDDLLAELRQLSDSERMKGNYLEQLAKHYLAIDPKWADQLGAVWLWKDWPERNGRPDLGIDLVAEIQGGGLLAIQVKFYDEAHKIQKSNLDSFFEAMGKEPFTEGLVIDTVRDWSANALEALKNRTKPVRRIGLDQLRHSDIDWATYELMEPQKAPQRHERKVPRAHQHRAISSVIEGFTRDPSEGGPLDRGKLIMACGTGKTFTALKLAERWTREHTGGVSTVLFMVPSLALLQQTLTEWSAERDPEMSFHAFAVGSDINIGRTKNGDLTSVMLEDLGAPATTDGAKLADLIESRGAVDEGMTVVFSTYQSIDAVAKAQRLGAPTFDLVICDEAHRTTGVTLADDDESHFVKVHDNDVISAEKRLYMTATPRIFAPEVKNTAREKDAELVSMDDERLYGPVLYRIGFHEAVQSQLLTDYKVVVLGVSEDQIVEGFQRQLAEDGHELQIGDVAKLVGCYNALAKREGTVEVGGFGEDHEPMRRAVAFAKDIRTSRRIANDFGLLADRHLSNPLNDDRTDNLTVQSRHVDGTMNATQRGELLDWLKDEPQADEFDRPVARVLTNARCLSEGVDVPSLDAVLFLNPRKSQVDVVQAVGRVMRRAQGKRLGYIVLPIAIPAGMDASEALNDNDRYKVVWQVLQALRAHDERLDTAINQATLTGTPPEQVTIVKLDLTSKKKDDGPGIGSAGGRDDDVEGSAGSGSSTDGAAGPSYTKPALFQTGEADDWKDAVYAKLVKKVGDRLYWDDWANDIGDIAKRFIALITAHVDAPGGDRASFEEFVKALRATVNPEVSEGEAIELLAQHLITKPVFEAMFPENSFTADNPVSVAMERVIATFHENQAFVREREPLEAFYATVTKRIRGLETVSAKQQMLVTLYDKFFTKAFPLLADKMGIVFTPVQVVDYILRSADAALHRHFGKRLSDEGVNILEPFVGTGTFFTRLMQTGLVKPEDLSRKYASEMFANEIVLLSYYIAAVNIESVYRELCAENGIEPVEGGFAGISLTDTFAMDERDSQLAGGVFPVNTARLENQRASKVDVIVMNPPYRSGQSSANDASQNAKYAALDERVKQSYVELSSATNKNGLYDSYYRALRWATDRLGNEGVIAFVSNSGFIDGGTADGVRLSWENEFSDVIVYNLRGNARSMGERRRREAGNVFGEGSQAGIAVTVLVKDSAHQGAARIHYADVGDYLTREEKLDKLVREGSIEGTTLETLTPNSAGDWINQRDDRFGTWAPIGDKETKGGMDTPGVFRDYSRGLATSRDAWAWNFSDCDLRQNICTHVDHLNDERERAWKLIRSGDETPIEKLISRDGTKGSWSRPNLRDLKRNESTFLDAQGFRLAQYRPFTKQHLYFDRAAKLNEMVYRMPRFWPTPNHPNLAISWTADDRRPSPPLLVAVITDLNILSATQLFPRHVWAPTSMEDGALNLDALAESDGEIVGDYRRVDNITDATLTRYREAYSNELPAGDAAAKDDIFYAVYALLHHSTYRETYAADLQKMLPRIPIVEGFPEYARIGRALADLHVDYESVDPYPLDEVLTLDAPEDPFELYRIQKLAWGSRKDRSTIRYNAHLTLKGILEDEALYKVGGRSPLEWVLDRYQVKTDKKSGITNDPNDWLREHDNPRYVVDLIKSLVTVSLETQRLIAELPDFVVIEGY